MAQPKPKKLILAEKKDLLEREINKGYKTIEIMASLKSQGFDVGEATVREVLEDLGLYDAAKLPARKRMRDQSLHATIVHYAFRGLTPDEIVEKLRKRKIALRDINTTNIPKILKEEHQSGSFIPPHTIPEQIRKAIAMKEDGVPHRVIARKIWEEDGISLSSIAIKEILNGHQEGRIVIEETVAESVPEPKSEPEAPAAEAEAEAETKAEDEAPKTLEEKLVAAREGRPSGLNPDISVITPPEPPAPEKKVPEPAKPVKCGFMRRLYAIFRKSN